MCLINFQWHKHPRYPLIIAANRDEFYERPTAYAHFWPDEPSLLAGRDMRQMGTWLGITKDGRFAALTNYRNPSESYENKRSRGELVKNYLSANLSPFHYLEAVHKTSEHYAGFNLLVGDTETLYYYNNIEKNIYNVPPGTHSLSNCFLNTPWPKVTKGKKYLNMYVDEKQLVQPNDLFQMLLDTNKAPEHELPHTGISRNLEKQLSPLFIQTPTYGTRASTVIIIDDHGAVTFIERTFDYGTFTVEKTFNFIIHQTPKVKP